MKNILRFQQNKISTKILITANTFNDGLKYEINRDNWDSAVIFNDKILIMDITS